MKVISVRIIFSLCWKLWVASWANNVEDHFSPMHRIYAYVILEIRFLDAIMDSFSKYLWHLSISNQFFQPHDHISSWLHLLWTTFSYLFLLWSKFIIIVIQHLKSRLAHFMIQRVRLHLSYLMPYYRDYFSYLYQFQYLKPIWLFLR